MRVHRPSPSVAARWYVDLQRICSICRLMYYSAKTIGTKDSAHCLRGGFLPNTRDEHMKLPMKHHVLCFFVYSPAVVSNELSTRGTLCVCGATVACRRQP